MTTIDWSRVRDGVARENNRMLWRPYGAPTILDLQNSALHDGEISTPWDIPEKIIISVAVTGAFFRHDQNPNQPLTSEAIRRSAARAAAAGASTVHIHVRDDDGYNELSLDRFEEVIGPLRRQFPDLAVDGCLVPALPGEWEQMRKVLDAGLLDATPVNATATYIGDSLFAKPIPILMEKTRLIQEAGLTPQIAVYTDGDVGNADRFLFRSGLITGPSTWIILPALPGGSPMNNPRQMVAGLTRITGAIHDVDPQATILVCAAGRAALYVATLAAAMGLHMRIGMEDTYWLWPHRPDIIESNEQVLGLGKSLAEVLGRTVATHQEYRTMTGISASRR